MLAASCQATRPGSSASIFNYLPLSLSLSLSPLNTARSSPGKASQSAPRWLPRWGAPIFSGYRHQPLLPPPSHSSCLVCRAQAEQFGKSASKGVPTSDSCHVARRRTSSLVTLTIFFREPERFDDKAGNISRRADTEGRVEILKSTTL